MATKGVVWQNFSGGWSTDLKIGIKNSQAYTQSIDFRKKPSQMTVLPGLVREDAGIAKDLMVNEVMTPTGKIFAFGNIGYIYDRTTAGVWSDIGKLGSSGFGMDYRQDSDTIYLTSNKTVSTLQPISGSPVLSPDRYNISFSTYNNSDNAGFNVSSYQINSNLTTQILTAINEGSTTLRYFQSDIEPLNKISVFIKAKGTGNWTLTLHDGLNNVLGTSTVTNSNLRNNDWNDFAFTSATNAQVRIYVAPNARTYHFHLTSTVNDGTVTSTGTNDLSTCDLMIYADRMIQTTNGLHPMTRFLQYEVFGNANYLSVWEPLSDPPTNDEWLRHKLVFPQEYEVCGLAVLNEYLAIACERKSTTDVQDGIIFWWDGLSPSYNFFTRIPEGPPYALREYKNVVYYYAGGDEYAIAGANSLPEKIRSMPNSDSEYSGVNSSTVIYPYAATTRRGIHLFAYPSVTTNTNIKYGVYSWGAVDKNYPNSFGYSYILSTGSQNYSVSNNLKIGMVRNFGNLMHVSWQDDLNGGFGVDVINNSSVPAPYAKWQGMIFDSGYTGRQKQAVYMDVYYSIPSGTSVKLGYSVDRGTFVTSPSYTSTSLWQGEVGYARFAINTSSGTGGRFYEIQPQLEITNDATVTTSPEIYMISLVFDELKDEQLL